jgi:DNA-binding LytR/AlgR family response regulator
MHPTQPPLPADPATGAPLAEGGTHTGSTTAERSAPTALIADDEPHLAAALARELSTLWPELRLLEPARNGVQAAQRIASESPDIAFLDIQMPGLTGLEVAEGIEGVTQVVFVTAYDQYAVQAFEHAAQDYLLKPVSRERLGQTVLRLQRHWSARTLNTGAAPLPPSDPTTSPRDTPDETRLLEVLRRLAPAQPVAAPPLRWIRAQSGDLTHQIAVDQVWYFLADDKYTCVITAQGEYLIRTPIAELAQQLDSQCFWQIHRSTIVNLAHMGGTRRDDNSRLFVRIRNHARELPVSRAYVHLFKAM